MSQGVGALDAVAVTRASLTYNQTEDRVSLTCAVNNYECVVLWLTARLANRLVPHLCQVVAQLPDASSLNSDQEVMDNDAAAPAESLENDATAGAVSCSAPEAPVVAEAGSVAWLVTAIDLTNGPMFVQLSFRDDQGQAPVLLSLAHSQLAQWSDGLKRCFVRASWSLGCWKTTTGADSQSRETRWVALH